MATREEWVRHFEDVNGRKPSPEEFMEAKKEWFCHCFGGTAPKCLSRLRLSRWIVLEATEEDS